MPQSPHEPTSQTIELDSGGHLVLYPEWLGPREHARLFDRLRSDTPWRQETIVIAGRTIQQPRLTAWYGDPGATYVYSGLKNEPLPWTEVLADLRRRVQDMTGAAFNSVLLNYYRDGHDAMGMHSDNERELGTNPLIASVSLGASRRFVVQHRKNRSDKQSIELAGGSLLVMAGTIQQHYKHGVPREARAGPRINLTFRRIVTEAASG